jgi:Kdo2-lipid IVA lauroyltransferase/acyltransferase
MIQAEHGRGRKKKGNLVTEWLLYAALRVVVALLGVWPVECQLRLARFLGRCLWKFYGRGRGRALENLQASFPDRGVAWRESVGRRSFEQMVMLAVDVLYTPQRVRKDNWRYYSTFKNVERCKWMMQEGRGLLLVSGHYGNFEIMGYLFSLFGFRLVTVARPLDNRFVDRYIRGIRERQGQQIIHKKGAADLMTAASDDGTSLGLIADQDAGRKGIFVEFFGRKASTFKSIALLAVTRNMPIVVGYSRRLEDRFFFEIGVTRMILPEEWANKPDPLRWITAEYTRAIEQFIREDPTQYWWVHRRWKTRPRDEEAASPPRPSGD